MNSLEQDSSLLLGSGDAIANLAQKDESMLLVVSDSHGADRILYFILREWGEKSDALIFCGDGISDLCRIISESEENKSVSKFLPPVIAMVEGNNDADIYPIRNPNYVQLSIPLNQTLEASGHRLFITHGHRFSLYNGTSYMVNEAVNQEAEIALYGHTHIAMAECSSALLTLNPGSCARPRGGLPPSFMTLKLRKGKDFFDYTFYRITGLKSEPFNPEPVGFF